MSRAPVECVILIGLPGAGKTTFYRETFAATHRHISKDLLAHVSNRAKRQARLIDEALADGASFVVDNTNATRAERALIIARARAAGARVVGFFLPVTTREAVARNRGREGMARVPDVAIFSVARRLEPPVLDEGFDELTEVGGARPPRLPSTN